MTRGNLLFGSEKDCRSNLAERRQPNSTNHTGNYTIFQPSFKPRNVGNRGLSFGTPVRQRQVRFLFISTPRVASRTNDQL
jgi:hypothetical protein